MTRWFRMYDEILDDPKVQKLPPADFKAWVNLLCLASKNDGKLPPVEDIAFRLRETPDAVSTLLERLLSGGLIECRSGGANGSHYAPNQWEKRQYKTDTSTERVKRFRKRSRNGDETFNETAPEPDTESDTEQTPPTPPKSGGLGSGRDCSDLASDLCRRAGIAKCGPAAIEQTGAWLADGIGAQTMRSVISSMAGKVAGSTRSLKRFDQPIRREHAEKGAKPNGHHRPLNALELEAAIRFRSDQGDEAAAAEYRRQLAELRAGAVAKLAVAQ